MDDSAARTKDWVASRSRALAISAIKEMSIRSAKVPGALSLAWGLPSFRTPAPIREAVEAALEVDPQAGMYALPAGLPELRAAAAETHRRRTGRIVDPDRHVTVTAGNMEGLNTLLHVIVDPGDEVIVTDPGFISHIQQIVFNGGRPVFWHMDEARGWDLDPGDLERFIGPRTKAILLVSPSNPTGVLLSERALRAAAEVARRNGLLVVLDDPYSHFLYDSRERFFDLAADPACADNLVYLFTFSKAYAMSGWRAGYMVMPEALRAEIVKIHDLTMICTPRVSQLAAIAALEGPQEHLADFERILWKRRSLICERLDRLPHLFDYVRPEGAYYVFPRLVGTAETSVEFAHRLLAEAGVAVTPGSAFGPSGEGHVRMAWCVEEETIDRAFDRIDALHGRVP